jgi:hypothetical protein
MASGMPSKMLDSSKAPVALRALKARIFSFSSLLITSRACRLLRYARMLFLGEVIIPKHVQAAGRCSLTLSKATNLRRVAGTLLALQW